MSVPPNLLYYGDNLDVLRRHVADESVDLVYLDPPFNSNADYNVLFAERSGEKAHAQIKAFEDTWEWGLEAAQEYAEVLRSGHDRVAKALRGVHDFLGPSDMMAYLAMMALRLIELRRVLKPTGSIYLHCDPTASHYLKIVMDAVFGPENFLSEVIWKRTGTHSSAKRWGPIHDTMLVFSKAEGEHTWNRLYVPLADDHKARHYRHVDEQGRRYTHGELTAPGVRHGRSGMPWRGFDVTSLGRHWMTTIDKLEELYKEGRIYLPEDGSWPRLIRYEEESKGRALGDVWSDISPINMQARERLGYPTQKPTELLERVVSASSNPNDIVLDPFCGCGTTIAAAQKLGRRWIGIDVTHLAITLIKSRLQDSFGPEIVKQYRVIGEPEDLAGARQLAEDDKFQFQVWALGLVGARPMEVKKGADRGIDGRLYFNDSAEPSDTKEALISVKGGGVTVSQVRDLRGTVEREGAAIGVFLCVEPPTKAMHKEAADAGFYTSPMGTRHPRLQILTVEDLLNGKAVDMPPWRDVRTFKRAPKAKARRERDAELF